MFILDLTKYEQNERKRGINNKTYTRKSERKQGKQKTSARQIWLAQATNLKRKRENEKRTFENKTKWVDNFEKKRNN